ncbi:MAG: phosphate signaling complex protein PhoU [Deltaproteobacteria bacterium]|jgi:phosphate transport system protein|nr:phosphate signaling complex protein PhoU [Deltaproteobacteria bacterium]
MVMGTFVNELALLSTSLKVMGEDVAAMLNKAAAALIAADESAADEVIKSDKLINQQENVIVDKTINLIAANQPVAGDLRFLAASLRLATELERIGDLGSNLARRTKGLAKLTKQGEQTEELPLKLVQMAKRSADMLDMALKALAERDAESAEAVLRLDDEIDDFNREIKRCVLETVYHDGRKAAWGLEIINTAAHLERLGDHATNLAEETIYMARGKNVRHNY